ncbi:adhesion G protein-coupled receptor E3-like [Cygnus olor]|uniref:adhesion G protein-coupled receptor E3-like n=1 Tax=Cygnus olor TaxID=8869 RepID=UPI001ADE057B|nr:adhesion G protein-coupled receptor E3-like [Cygnus olor]
MWLWGHEDVLMGSLSLGRDPGIRVGDKDVVMGSGGCGYGDTVIRKRLGHPDKDKVMGSLSLGGDPSVPAGTRPPGPQVSRGGSLVTALRCHEWPRASAHSKAGEWKGVGSGFGAERWFWGRPVLLPLCHRCRGATASPSLVMGYPHLAACLWALCCLLSLLHAAAGAASALQCDTQSCSASSCCLGLPTSSRQQRGGHWVCGCPHSMVRTIQNSSVVVCQEACNVTTLGMIRELCKEKKSSPLCSQLLDTTKNLKETCDNTTKEGLQAMLSQLQNVARKEQCKQHGAIAATLLMESTEAIVLQARHRDILELNTTIMQAKTEVVNNTCITSGWELELNVDEEKLNINCSMLPKNTDAVAFIVYNRLEDLLNSITEPSSGKLNSKVVGGTVGKANITFPATFNITLQHTETLKEGEKLLCVSWKLNGSKGQWTPEGCQRVGGDNSSSICACNHFSTFAMLMNVNNKRQNNYVLDMVTYVGLSVSLLCLFLTIVTFILCRSLWSVSISLHLQLSICLFIADFLLLVAECLTTKELACKIIAGFLHYFFLASFAWMFLEGLHLFLTVRNLRVLNYINANRFKRRYIYPVGYGLPAIVVATSVAIHPKGYGTKQHCWLNTEGGFIWSFVGPVCVIILINLTFFLITLWTLQKRLSSLNADVTAIKNTRLMMFKALAHVCILGCTWGVGLLQAPERVVVDFVFTIINSLQGAFIFLVHCVLNRQVMEHYRHWFRVLGRSPKPQEMATTEMQITYVTEGERSQSHSAEGCAWEK